jgi:hypothetical protein
MSLLHIFDIDEPAKEQLVAPLKRNQKKKALFS